MNMRLPFFEWFKPTIPDWSASVSKSTSRLLTVQIIPRLTGWKQSNEVPKVAVWRHRGVAALHALPHIPPLLAALVLIALNLKGYYVGTVSATTITGLQFAAKAMEVTMQLSLGTTLLGLVRQTLTGGGQCSLGVLVAPLRVSDISYLWSLELWSSLTFQTPWGWQTKSSLVFVPTVVALAAVVGPSSAVLMIPRPILHHEFKNLLLMDNGTYLYPSHVDYLDTEALNATMPQIAQVSETGSFLLTEGDVTREMVTRRAQNTGVFMATLPSRPLTRGLYAGSWILNPNQVSMTRGRQPLVRTCCHDNVLRTTDPTSTYLDFGNCSNVDHRITFAEAFQYSMSNLSVYFQAPSRNSPEKHSALMVLGVHGDGAFEAYACTVDAAWTPSLLNMSLLSQPAITIYGHPKLDLLPSELISISSKWTKGMTDVIAASLIPDGDSPGLTAMVNSPELVIAVALANSNRHPFPAEENEDPLYNMIQSGLTLQQKESVDHYVLEMGLNETYGAIMTWTTEPWTDPRQLTHQVLLEGRTGYGYDASTVTVKLSMTVLCLYSFVTMIYLGYVLITGITGSSLDSISELVMLALCSQRPAHLGDISAGLGAISTLREPVSIKVDDEDSLQLVFENDTATVKVPYRRVEYNKAY